MIPDATAITTNPTASQGKDQATPKLTGVTATPPSLYNSSVDDDLFDDACDLGQFMLNPSWYIFVKIRGGVRDFLRWQTDIQTISQEAQRSSYLHLQRPLYLLFVIGGWTFVFRNVYPLIRASPLLSDTHLSIGYTVAAMCVLSWKVASTTCPGEITAETVWKFDHYPYDNLLYRNDAIFPTHPQLLLRKLARSKYDRFTRMHIPRFDHFCGWLGQPIGEENYREFLIFVAVHAFMCTYGSLVTGILILGQYSPQEGRGWWDLRLQDSLVTILMFAFLTSACVPLIGFFAFHMYLIAKGMTTNEYFKWRLISTRHAAAMERFQQQQQQQQKLLRQQHHSLHLAVSDTDVEKSSGSSSKDVPQEELLTDPGPHPRNQYDNGLLQNLLEVLRPHSLRRGRRRQPESSKSD